MSKENLNLFITFFTPVFIAVCGVAFYSKLDTVRGDVLAHSDANVAALKQTITENYETQTAHAQDMQKIGDWTQKIQAAQNAQNLSIQHLTDVISTQQKSNN